MIALEVPRLALIDNFLSMLLLKVSKIMTPTPKSVKIACPAGR